MAYVAVRGGHEAIEASLDLREKRRRDESGKLSALRDQVMSEASLYDETSADLAIIQSEGSPEEAVFLLRAFRSTLIRKGATHAVSGREIFVERRISAAFKQIPGGQILGPSPDYSHRLLDFNLLEDEAPADAEAWFSDYAARLAEYETENAYGDGSVHAADPGVTAGPGVTADATHDTTATPKDVGALLTSVPKVVDYLRGEGLMKPVDGTENAPVDITREGLQFPTVRSSRLQVLSRGQTGALTALGYASLRGWGDVVVHPTVCELRVGLMPLTISAGEEEDGYFIGEVRVTEVESLMPIHTRRGPGRYDMEFELGYGGCFGQNETKAIAMSMIDYNLENPDPGNPSSDEEFVLYHIDSVEATGFISHLKLPHYVTFQSKLDAVRRSRDTAQTGRDTAQDSSDPVRREETRS